MENTTVNRIQMKALLHDCIMYHRFKRHLAPNWKGVKDLLCKAAGQPTNISNIDTIRLIGLTMQENGLTEDFDRTLGKFDLREVVYNG